MTTRPELTPEERAYRTRQAEETARFSAWATAACAAFLRAPREYDEWKRHHPPPRPGQATP